jgi:hypothetical protein
MGDVFRFTNSTPKDPVVHMQQLRNIGRTIRRGDLRRDGDRWIIPGLDPQKLLVENVI